MWANVTDNADSIRDYTIATGLTTSPIWVPILANINVILTTATLLVGLLVGCIRLYKDFKGKPKTDDKQ